MHVFDQLEEVEQELHRFDVTYDLAEFLGQQLSESELLDIVDRYDGILAGDDELTGQVLREADRLRVIAKWGIGIDAIDTEVASELGIQVLNTPGVFGHEIADYALAYLLMLFRQQHVIHQRVKAGDWPKLRGRSVSGHTLGIVGLGSSGRELARRAKVLGMNIVGYDVVRPPDGFLEETDCELVDLDDVFRRSDVVSLHAPLTDDNHHLVDGRRLALMSVDSHLINTARGPLVDQEALIEALQDDRLAGAALDVFEEEPLPQDSPLRGLDNVILGSHNASNTEQAVERTTRLAVDNLLRGLGYEP